MSRFQHVEGESVQSPIRYTRSTRIALTLGYTLTLTCCPEPPNTLDSCNSLRYASGMLVVSVLKNDIAQDRRGVWIDGLSLPIFHKILMENAGNYYVFLNQDGRLACVQTRSQRQIECRFMDSTELVGLCTGP